jgi:hypothetical protein
VLAAAHFVRDFPVRQTFRYKPATVSSRFESRFARPERLAGSSVSSGQALRANSRDAHYWLALDAPRGCTSRAFRAAAGVTGVIALAYIIFPGSAVGVAGYALAWSLLGACTGFLIFNFLPPRKNIYGRLRQRGARLHVAFLGLDFIAAKGAGNASLVLAFPLLVAALSL